MQLCLPLDSQNRSDLIPKCCLCCILSCCSLELTLPLPSSGLRALGTPTKRPEHRQRSLPHAVRVWGKTGLRFSNPSQTRRTGKPGTMRAEGEPTPPWHNQVQVVQESRILYIFFQSSYEHCSPLTPSPPTPRFPGTFVEPFLCPQLMRIKNKQHSTDREHLGERN